MSAITLSRWMRTDVVKTPPLLTGELPSCIKMIPTDLSSVAFCDGAHYPELGIIKSACWFAQDCRFFVCEQKCDPTHTKQQSITLAEAIAVRMAIAQFNPKLIYTDSVHIARRYSDRCQHIRRKYNTIADKLTKAPSGSGHVIFHNTLPCREWLSFLYD